MTKWQLIQVCTPTLYCLHWYTWVNLLWIPLYCYHHPLEARLGLGHQMGCNAYSTSAVNLGTAHTWLAEVLWYQMYKWYQWRIQGGAAGARPPRVQILSFWHTNFSKRSCLGSWRPPTRSAPPYEKSWIRYWVCFALSIACKALNIQGIFMERLGSLQVGKHDTSVATVIRK